MTDEPAIQPNVLDRLKAIVGPLGWIEDDARMASYLVDIRNLYQGAAPLILRPSSTKEVAAVVEEAKTADAPTQTEGDAAAAPEPEKKKKKLKLHGTKDLQCSQAKRNL